MKKLILLLSSAAVIFSAAGQGLNGEKNEKEYKMQNVMDYGAKGDGVTVDTQAIQAAVDAGGMVYFPPGTYLAGSIYLKSHGGLHIAQGAVLKMNPDLEDYNKPDFTPWNWECPSEYSHGKHLLIAVDQEDITLCGGGVIHGNDRAFMDTANPIKEYMVGIWNVKPCGKPGQMLYFNFSKNIRIEDLELRNSSYWHCYLHGCNDVMIRNVRVRGDHNVNTNDGFDIDCCKNVIVSDCDIDTADDAIAIRGSSLSLKDRAQPCENVVVSNCILSASYAAAVRVGVGNGEIRNCMLSNILVPHAGTAILIQSRYSEASTGTSIENITFHNWKILDTTKFMKIAHETFVPQKANTKPIRDLVFSDMDVRGKRTVFIHGNGTAPFGNFTFRNIRMTYDGCGPHPDIDPGTGWWGNLSTDSVFEISNAKDVEFDHVKVFLSHPGWKHFIAAADPEEIHLNRVSAPMEPLVRLVPSKGTSGTK